MRIVLYWQNVLAYFVMQSFSCISEGQVITYSFHDFQFIFFFIWPLHGFCQEIMARIALSALINFFCPSLRVDFTYCIVRIIRSKINPSTIDSVPEYGYDLFVFMETWQR